MGAKVERLAKTCLLGAARGIEQVSPTLLERCYGSLALFLNISLLEKVHVKPLESLSNLRFAIRTILESKGEVVNEKEITRLAQETTRNFFASVVETLNILYKDSWPKFVEPKIPDEGCYTAEIGKIIIPKEYSKTEDKKEIVRTITQAVIAELEPMIAEHPASFYSFFEPLWEK